MSAAVLLDRLDRVRRAGPGRWRARCPVHGGRNPSAVSIRETDDGTVRVYCFVCEANGLAIAEAVGVDPAELFPARDLLAGEHRRRPERRPWTAHDVLRGMSHEITVAAIIACDIAKRGTATDHERTCLLKVAGRLGTLQEMVR